MGKVDHDASKVCSKASQLLKELEGISKKCEGERLGEHLNKNKRACVGGAASLGLTLLVKAVKTLI